MRPIAAGSRIDRITFYLLADKVELLAIHLAGLLILKTRVDNRAEICAELEFYQFIFAHAQTEFFGLFSDEFFFHEIIPKSGSACENVAAGVAVQHLLDIVKLIPIHIFTVYFANESLLRT